MSTVRDPANLRRERFVNIRKLVALDMTLHGARFILAEFALGIVLCGAAGVWLLAAQNHSPFTIFLGVLLVSAALSYVALFVHAVSLARGGNPRAEVAYELEHRDQFVRTYSVQQFLIFVPLAIPLLALVQLRRGNRAP